MDHRIAFKTWNQVSQIICAVNLYLLLREMCLSWFGHVSRRPEAAPVCRVERLQVVGTGRKGRPLKTWSKR